MEEKIVQILVQSGISGIIVIAWYLFNRANMAAFESILSAQQVRDNANMDMLRSVIASQDKRADDLREAIEGLTQELRKR